MDGGNTTSLQTTGQINVEHAGVIKGLILLCKIVLTSILCLTIWIAISMITYGRRKKKWNFSKKGGRMYIACFIPVPFAITRYTIDIVRSFEREIPGAMDHCGLLADISDCVFGIAIFTAYLFLWMKQKAIYAHPIVQPTGRRVINVFSWGLLVMITYCSVALICAFVIPDYHGPGPYGCMEEEPVPGEWDAIKVFVLGGLTGFWQMGLLGLFLYPIIRNRSKSTRILTASNKSRKNSNQKTNNQADRVMYAIKRSIIFAAIATFSDSISALVGMLVIPWSYPVIMKHTLYDFNLLVNIFCILSTFGKNQEILMVRCKAKNMWKSSSRITTSTYLDSAL